MQTNNSYGLSILFLFALLICLTFAWNIIFPRRPKMNLDQAEKIFIFSLAALLVLFAIYSTFSRD